MYGNVLSHTSAGQPGAALLIGATATPWRSDEFRIKEAFGAPAICVDLVTGLKNGFLSNVEYRMHTDNIDWSSLKNLQGKFFSPKGTNRKFFISNWDDAVVLELQKSWKLKENPRAIIFCGTIDHALTTRDRINALGFCRAESIYSRTKSGHTQEPAERNKILCDFQDGSIQAVCVVDIFNEGVDVPDVNIIVFQRVTHSRRIFIQQLGRGLRLSKGKESVLVLDFVSDIRRFAAGINLKDSLTPACTNRQSRITLPYKVEFHRVGQKDPKTESFLRQWLDDVAAIEEADEDSSILKFPPKLDGAKNDF